MSTFATSIKQTWDKVVYGGASTAAIQNALNTYSRVLLRGNFTLTAALALNDNQRLGIRGTLTKGFNGDMIENDDQGAGEHNDNIVISGEPYGILLGEGATYTGRGIYFYERANPTVTMDTIMIRNLRIYDTADHAIEILEGGFTHLYKILHCVLYPNAAAAQLGLMLNSASDYEISGCLPINGGAQVYSGATGRIHDSYINQGLQVYYGRGLQLSNLLINTSGQIALDLQGVDYSVFNNITCWESANGASVDACDMVIHTARNCTDNLFSNMYLGRIPNAAAGTTAYTDGIDEADANQDNNCYVNINGRDCTRALHLRGAASKSLHQNINGTVTEA